jgi:glycerol-3-phosphate dehydrogenase
VAHRWSLCVSPSPSLSPSALAEKLQGTITSKDVDVVLKAKGLSAEFPLFTRIHEIAFEGKAPSAIVEL